MKKYINLELRSKNNQYTLILNSKKHQEIIEIDKQNYKQVLKKITDINKLAQFTLDKGVYKDGPILDITAITMFMLLFTSLVALNVTILPTLLISSLISISIKVSKPIIENRRIKKLNKIKEQTANYYKSIKSKYKPTVKITSINEFTNKYSLCKENQNHKVIKKLKQTNSDFLKTLKFIKEDSNAFESKIKKLNLTK